MVNKIKIHKRNKKGIKTCYYKKNKLNRKENKDGGNEGTIGDRTYKNWIIIELAEVTQSLSVITSSVSGLNSSYKSRMDKNKTGSIYLLSVSDSF